MKLGTSALFTWALLFSALLPRPAAAAGPQYVLTAPDERVAQIAAVHYLTVTGQAGPDTYVVTGPRWLPPWLLMLWVNNSPLAGGGDDDDGVIRLEIDAILTLPEKGIPGDLLAPGTGEGEWQIPSAPYFGTAVWEAYIDQDYTDLPNLINIEEAQALSRGNTIVAVIDTGADPWHHGMFGTPPGSSSGWETVLVPGFDFTRGMPGGAPELADLTPSELGIINPSTTGILDFRGVGKRLSGSTVAFLNPETAGGVTPGQLPEGFGHGTMVSGLVRRVAPGARIMPLKAFSRDGYARLQDVLRAIYFAADNGAKVINMSFGFPNAPSTEVALANAIRYAHGKGAISVASAGNSAQAGAMYPARLPEVISVGATDAADQRANFSNFGPGVTLAAPGDALISLYPGGNYGLGSGTSYSAPLVAGAVALLAELDSSVTAETARAALIAGAKPLPGQDLGAGRLDLLAVINAYLQGK